MAALLLLLAALAAGTVRAAAAAAEGPLSLLYFIVDDLRPELEAYGVTAAAGTAGSPHIAALAEDSLVFERAYCQQAVCGPSRNSFLSGRRPDVTKVRVRVFVGFSLRPAANSPPASWHWLAGRWRCRWRLLRIGVHVRKQLPRRRAGLDQHARRVQEARLYRRRPGQDLPSPFAATRRL